MLSSDPRSYFYYSPKIVSQSQNCHLPGVANFAEIYKLWNATVAIVDRSHVIQTPVRTRVIFPIPKFETFVKSYSEICDERAVQLLNHSEQHDLPIYLFYSGGIDSTVVLSAFLKNAKPHQMDRVTLLLSNESIGENLSFYKAHIQDKIKQRVSITFPYLLTKKSMFVCGEFNDQLFGSDMIRTLINFHGPSAIQAPYHRDYFFKLWSPSLPNANILNGILDLLEGVKAAAPIPISTNAEFLWWLNFSLKWQSVFLRIMIYTAKINIGQIDREFVTNNFFAFFNTEDFQLWSMNNNEKKIRDAWDTYKYTAKDYIFEFHRDEHYRKTKTKRGSLYWILLHQEQKNFMTDDFVMHAEQSAEQWYSPENSFLSIGS